MCMRQLYNENQKGKKKFKNTNNKIKKGIYIFIYKG